MHVDSYNKLYAAVSNKNNTRDNAMLLPSMARSNNRSYSEDEVDLAINYLSNYSLPSSGFYNLIEMINDSKDEAFGATAIRKPSDQLTEVEKI
ncbi:hypothetical protein [Zymomonas mobilis]|uniref:Uncharacterized protein n=1 Tax=Zymomonas mobilis subsp. mobilis (strain ATCC 10988 / DSM 424 / LMG 404 / NCIMB 8938 / NRRL B-806 / ZM1) TaxID=555217 RepID=A0A0H3G417_ZYMMA|nr:hypothetical protein [Zymomonas mobilis]AEH63579.1 hypothetical protein Zmob_1778 [Zymomonas mobilis subsp. mobilis ATCC 10988]TQL26705.1 hypothetical protein FBY54_1822 [Zymomonas mobilis]